MKKFEFLKVVVRSDLTEKVALRIQSFPANSFIFDFTKKLILGEIAQLFSRNFCHFFRDLIIEYNSEKCEHPTIMKNMCAECGADLQQEMSIVPSAKVSAEASISIVHSIPELKVSSNVRNNSKFKYFP